MYISTAGIVNIPPPDADLPDTQYKTGLRDSEALVSSDSVFGADYGLFFRLLLRVLRIIISNMTTRV